MAEIPVGPRSLEMLEAAGITTLEELIELGEVDAFLRVKAAGYRPTLNFVYGLYAAIEGIDWREIPTAERNRLRRAIA